MKLIGKGRTANVYLHNGKAIKVFHGDISDEWIAHELKINEIAGQFGAPKTYGYENLDDRKGIAFEYLDGKVLSEYIQENPAEMRSIGRALGKLHKRVHEGESTELLSQKERYQGSISHNKLLSREMKHALLRHLESLPTKQNLCHGDFHIQNVIVTDTWRVIDWTNAYVGDPLSDVARSMMIMESPVMWQHAKWYLRPIIKMVMGSIRKQYIKAYGCKKRELKQWRPIVLASRLHEGIAVEKDWLLAQLSREMKGHSFRHLLR